MRKAKGVTMSRDQQQDHTRGCEFLETRLCRKYKQTVITIIHVKLGKTL